MLRANRDAGFHKPRCRISHTAHRRHGVTAAQRRSFTRYRISSRVVAHVTSDPATSMFTPVCGAIGRLPTCYRARMERSCFYYRSAPAPSALPVAASPLVRSMAAERSVTGVVTTIQASARTGARQDMRTLWIDAVSSEVTAGAPSRRSLGVPGAGGRRCGPRSVAVRPPRPGYPCGGPCRRGSR